jgi:D-alanyl-D-alanine carboxypeptidase/D-alanyl-D-alanine-endopeptidase (penicillin-binding protein 4)
MEVLPGEASGNPALFRTYPVEAGLELINNIKTTEPGETPWMGIERSADGQRYTFVGKIPLQHPGLTYRLAASDPAIFAARLLRRALLQRGIVVSGEPKSRQLLPLDIIDQGKPSLIRARQLRTTYPDERKVARVIGVPLSETVKVMMKISHNLYAEMLLRTLGDRSAGLGSVETGTAELERFLEKAGTPKGQLSLSDGSGLSRKNLITPESVVRLLQYMDRSPERNFFLDALPISGRDGTLKKRMTAGPAFERISAKTGALNLSARCKVMQWPTAEKGSRSR